VEGRFEPFRHGTTTSPPREPLVCACVCVCDVMADHRLDSMSVKRCGSKTCCPGYKDRPVTRELPFVCSLSPSLAHTHTHTNNLYPLHASHHFRACLHWRVLKCVYNCNHLMKIQKSKYIFFLSSSFASPDILRRKGFKCVCVCVCVLPPVCVCSAYNCGVRRVPVQPIWRRSHSGHLTLERLFFSLLFPSLRLKDSKGWKAKYCV